MRRSRGRGTCRSLRSRLRTRVAEPSAVRSPGAARDILHRGRCSNDDYFTWVKYTAEFDPSSTDPTCDLSDPAWRDSLACIAVSTDSISDCATTENVIDTIGLKNLAK
jgi:hypothetical protein